MTGVASDLADMVDMVDDVGQRNEFARCLASHIARIEHPVVEGRTDHAAALDNEPDLIIGELAIPRDKRPAVIVTGQDRTVVDLEGLVEALISEMGQVKDQTAGFDCLEHGPAVGVAADPIMDQANDPKSGGIPVWNLIRRNDGVGALHADDKAERCLIRPPACPLLNVLLERRPVGNDAAHALSLKLTVIGQASHGESVGHLWRAKVEAGGAPRVLTGQQSSRAHGDISRTHLREGYCTTAAPLLRHAGLVLADLVHALA